MKKKQTKTGPKSVTGFSILKIYLQEKQQKEDWILNRKKKKQGGIFSGNPASAFWKYACSRRQAGE